MCDVLIVLPHSKHSLGSHEYVQNCRKWENEITLQLLSRGTMRRDLARTVSVSVGLQERVLGGWVVKSLRLVFRRTMTRVPSMWRNTWAGWTGRSGRTSPGMNRSGTTMCYSDPFSRR